MLLSFWNQMKKQLKKKLRWKKRWLSLAVLLLAAGIFAAGLWLSRSTTLPVFEEGLGGERAVFGHKSREPVQAEEEVRKVMKSMDGQREAFARTAYVCGEELQRLGLMSAEQVLDYYKQHPGAIVSLGSGSEVYFTEKVEDLAPKCRDNAYFGLDPQGHLSLFEGVPTSGGGNVIRTFFQLNIQFLESSLPRETVKQLYNGIRVRDLEDYNSVLSTLSDYAVEETEKVMQTSPAN